MAAYSVVLDRGIGLTGLAVLVVACLPWTLALVHDPVGRAALLVIGLGSICGALAFLVLGSRHLSFLQRWTPTRHLADIARVAVAIVLQPRSLASIFSVTLSVHMLTVLSAWCAAHAVGAGLSLQNSLFLVLPVVLVAAVPISIAGWGVRESAMMAAFVYAGLSQNDGLLVSLLFGCANFVIGLAGGLVWTLSTDPAKPDSHDPPLGPIKPRLERDA